MHRTSSVLTSTIESDVTHPLYVGCIFLISVEFTDRHIELQENTAEKRIVLYVGTFNIIKRIYDTMMSKCKRPWESLSHTHIIIPSACVHMCMCQLVFS